MTDASRHALSSRFDPRLNGLNLVRLLLATGVIFWHAYPLTGNTLGPWPLHQLVAEVWVDGFFAISGFLILGSWMRKPEPRAYLRARALRIFPGFWVCLALTALIISPLATLSFSADNIMYMVRNGALWMFQAGIGGEPSGIPYPGVWNGSLWTLGWEFLCYLAVLGLGMTGALNRRWAVEITFAAFVLLTAVTTLGPIDNFNLEAAARFGVMYFAGSLVYRYQNRVPVRWYWIAAATAIVAVALVLPNYRLIAALPLAYALISISALIRVPALRLKNDISYGVYIYAFPVQQILALTGLWVIGPTWFALVSVAATIPLAIGSWFMIEKPALRLKGRRQPAEVPTRSPGFDGLAAPRAES